MADYRRSVDTKVHWGSPNKILDRVRRVGPIDLDPCSNTAAAKRVRARVSWMLNPEDGLVEDWKSQVVSRGGLVYVNFPYGDARWPDKMAKEAIRGTPIVGLMSSGGTETNWWNHCIVPYSVAVCFVKGRLDFIDCTAEPDFDDNPAQLDFWEALPPPSVGDNTKSGATFGSAVVTCRSGQVEA